MVTDKEVALWNVRLGNTARKLAMLWAGRQDQRPLIEDLKSAGWITLLTFGSSHPRIHYEIQNSMQDEIAKWLWGVTRAQRPRLLKIALPLEKAYRVAVDPRLSPLQIAELRQKIMNVWKLLPEELQILWVRMAMNLQRDRRGKYTTARLSVLCRDKGWSAKQIHTRKKRLRHIVKTVLSKP